MITDATATAEPAVLMLSNAPAPYRIPLFNEIQRELLTRASVPLIVYFASPASGTRLWTVALDEALFEFVIGEPEHSHDAAAGEFQRHSYRGLLALIRRRKPGLVLVDGFSPGATKVALSARISNVRYGLWGGPIDDPGGPLAGARRLQRRFVTAGARGAIAHSTQAKNYLIGLGMPADHITLAFNTVDTNYFRPGDEPAQACKARPFHFVSIGTLNDRKRFDRLISAAARLRQKTADFLVSIAGTGPDAEKLKQQIQDDELEQQVVLLGHLSQQAVLELLQQADAFVFPTGHDIWGLVLSEAMAVGLPVISSIDAAATNDLVEDGHNGYAVDFDRSNKVAMLMEEMVRDRELAHSLGQNARSTVLEKARLELTASRYANFMLEQLASSRGKS